MIVLDQSFYARDTACVARELLGMIFVREINGVLLTGIITETEAYTSDDPACHAYRGKTRRNAVLFGPVGHAYVYFVYGMHFCFNVVARDAVVPAGGVLIRAIKPLHGVEIMQKNRRVVDVDRIAAGPGALTQAYAITREHDGMNMTRIGMLYIAHGECINQIVTATPRIGISVAKDVLWRFVLT